MKGSKKVVVAGLLVGLAGCVVNPPVRVSSSFDVVEAQRLLEGGPNVIRGSALIRQRGGGVVSCAGLEVSLVPVTAYATERVAAIYGSTDKGFNSSGPDGRKIQFANEAPVEYQRLQRHAICDAQGFFKFDQVANGDFFVVTTITWRVNDYFVEGGALMQRVSVNGGEIKEVVLAP